MFFTVAGEGGIRSFCILDHVTIGDRIAIGRNNEARTTTYFLLFRAALSLWRNFELKRIEIGTIVAKEVVEEIIAIRVAFNNRHIFCDNNGNYGRIGLFNNVGDEFFLGGKR